MARQDREGGRRTKVYALAFGAILAMSGLAVTDDSVHAQWTEDYDCDEAFWTNNHKVDNGLGDWSNGTHPYWPGDCGNHQGPGDGDG